MLAKAHSAYGVTAAIMLAMTLLLLIWPPLNLALFQLLNGGLSPAGQALWANLTNLGDALLATALGIAIFARTPQQLVHVFLSVIIVGLLVHMGKSLFNYFPVFDTLQSRPVGRLGLVCGGDVLTDCVNVTGKALRHYSFPSGHAAAATTVATLLCLKLNSQGWRIAALVVFALAAVSRVVVGAHWPVDVTCGAVLGILGTLFSVWLADHRIPKPGVKACVALLIFAMMVSFALYFNAQDYEQLPGVNLVENTLATIALIMCSTQLWRMHKASGS